MTRPKTPADRQPALDADVTGLLDAALGSGPDAASSTRIRSRLLRRIASECTDRHLTLAPAAGTWRPFGAGLQLKVLHEAADIMSYLVRMEAGASLPSHRHPVDEECLVLEGEVRIGALRLGAGGFHVGRRNVLHDRLVSENGALIYLRGARPVPELAI
jgi:anti-sigma factor ChrR (cupin superfamily)